MANFPKVSQDNFDQEVLQAALPVLVDFSAVWCGPCKMLDPVVTQLAHEWQERVKVVQVDVDESPDLAVNYQVMGVPTLILFVNGENIERMTGYQPKERVAAKFAPHLI